MNREIQGSYHFYHLYINDVIYIIDHIITDIRYQWIPSMNLKYDEYWPAIFGIDLRNWRETFY